MPNRRCCAGPLDGKPYTPDKPPPEPMGSGLFQQRYSGEFFNILKSARSQLRRSVRAKRRSLTPYQQAEAARKLFIQLRRHPSFRFSKRLAFYIAIDGEISPHLLIAQAHKYGKKCYLPVLRKDGQDKLLFLEYKTTSKLHKNSFRLSEPAIQRRKTAPAWTLNTIFMPLVAFDAEGSRLGMGKGYYDRSFAFLKTFNRSTPKLLGLAHECQKVEKLETASWDVPLEKIVTDLKIYQAK